MLFADFRYFFVGSLLISAGVGRTGMFIVMETALVMMQQLRGDLPSRSRPACSQPTADGYPDFGED